MADFSVKASFCPRLSENWSADFVDLPALSLTGFAFRAVVAITALLAEAGLGLCPLVLDLADFRDFAGVFPIASVTLDLAGFDDVDRVLTFPTVAVFTVLSSLAGAFAAVVSDLVDLNELAFIVAATDLTTLGLFAGLTAFTVLGVAVLVAVFTAVLGFLFFVRSAGLLVVLDFVWDLAILDLVLFLLMTRLSSG